MKKVFTILLLWFATISMAQTTYNFSFLEMIDNATNSTSSRGMGYERTQNHRVTWSRRAFVSHGSIYNYKNPTPVFFWNMENLLKIYDMTGYYTGSLNPAGILGYWRYNDRALAKAGMMTVDGDFFKSITLAYYDMGARPVLTSSAEVVSVTEGTTTSSSGDVIPTRTFTFESPVNYVTFGAETIENYVPSGQLSSKKSQANSFNTELANFIASIIDNVDDRAPFGSSDFNLNDARCFLLNRIRYSVYTPDQYTASVKSDLAYWKDQASHWQSEYDRVAPLAHEYEVLSQYSRGDVNRDKSVSISDVTSLTNILLGKDGETVYNDYVDLGLPSGTLWCTHNVGTAISWKSGDFYAWGETEPKEQYGMRQYKFFDMDKGLTKYNETDGLTILEDEDDVVNVERGGGWRIPTSAQWQELIDNCTWEKSYNSWQGYYFYTITGTNGKSIELPCYGFIMNASQVVTEQLYYWSRNVNNDDLSQAYILMSNSQCEISVSYSNKFNGMPIRAVRN